MNSPRVAARAFAGGLPRMEYRALAAHEALPATALCAISFGAHHPVQPSAPRALRVHVDLPPLHSAGLVELWHADAPVMQGLEGELQFACGGHYLAGQLVVDERAAGGLAAAAASAYERISRFTARSAHRHLLRMYNYFSAINSGAGDEERYKQFCAGRAAGFKALPGRSWPAATAVGRPGPGHLLQVYWLASDEPGGPLENPRQMSAFDYPRQYGPAPPHFSRAMRLGDGLLISGTASVLGHASHHPGDLPAQLDEILRNLASLRQAAGLAAAPGRGTLLKVYLREAAAAARVAERLRAQLSPQVQLLVLHADICRRELLVEIDAVHLGHGG